MLCMYRKDKELIEKVQRRFTHMIPDLKDLPYEQRLAKTKLGYGHSRTDGWLISSKSIINSWIVYTVSS